MKKVANPPKPLKRATISGMEVILTLIAITEPIKAPNKIPPRTTKGLTILIAVTIIAINIPIAEIKLPL